MTFTGNKTYVKCIDPVLDRQTGTLEVTILAQSVHDASHGSVSPSVSFLRDGVAHVHTVLHFA